MRFNHPDFVFLFFLIPVVLALLSYHAWRQKRAWQALADAPLRNKLMPTRSPVRILVKDIFKVLALCFLVLALMEPQWGMREEEESMRGAAMMMLLDDSDSVLA